MLAVAVGGAAVFAGPVLGAIFLVAVQDFLRESVGHLNLVYGIAVLVVALGLKDGIGGSMLNAWHASGTACDAAEAWSRGPRRRRPGPAKSLRSVCW